MKRLIKRAFLIALGVLLAVGLLILATLVYQGWRKPSGNPEYVAIGSSFAAGLGLGARAPGSPLACQRSINGYPQRLARAARLSLVDMTCSGATAGQVLRGGQFFQGPQIAAVRPDTRLVTLTAGGNDVAYIGDLISMGYANRGGAAGWLASRIMGPPPANTERNFGKLGDDLHSAIVMLRNRAPTARIVVATYPVVLPLKGSCAALGLTEEQVMSMRPVEAEFAAITRAAVHAGGGAILVDMATIGVGHDACSPDPWVNGFSPISGAPFHPTQAGAIATAREVARASGFTVGR